MPAPAPSSSIAARRLVACLFVAGLLASCAARLVDTVPLADAEGPALPSKPISETRADWRAFGGGAVSRFAILLTEPKAAWLGLAHGFKSLGIPFTITDSLEEALAHDVVLVYPGFGHKASKDPLPSRLLDFVAGGGTLLSSQVPSKDLYGLFGIDRVTANRKRSELEYAESAYAASFAFPEERRIRIGNPKLKRARPRTQSFKGSGAALARYDDGEAAIFERRSGAGLAIAFGFDLGKYVMTAQNNRDEEANRLYVNGFDPSVDTVLRFLREIFRDREDDAVAIHSAPDGFPLSVLISHDVDYSGSLANSVAYAVYERSMGYGATYFLQTKYYRDFFDEVFFDSRTPELLSTLESLGMELASHSVSHTDMLARLPQGSFDERYPEYQPRVVEFSFTRDATLMGELRVSKHLIERFSHSTVVSFRPGFLAYPFSLPESLESAGYRYSSAVTANDVMTHLPYRLNYDRLYRGETAVFEFPVTIEDEKDPPMDGRVGEALEIARRISRYGGVFVVLIHPNVTADKFRFLKGFTEGLRDRAWWGTLEEFGSWWSARDGVEADLVRGERSAALRLRSALPIAGLGIALPADLEPVDDYPARRVGAFWVFDLAAGTSEVPLRAVARVDPVD